MSVERTHRRDRISVPIYRCLDTQLSVYVLSTSKTKAGGTRCNRCQLNHCYAVGCLCHSSGYLREAGSSSTHQHNTGQTAQDIPHVLWFVLLLKELIQQLPRSHVRPIIHLVVKHTGSSGAGRGTLKLGGRAYWTPPPLYDFLGGSGAKLCVRVCPRFRTLADTPVTRDDGAEKDQSDDSRDASGGGGVGGGNSLERCGGLQR